MSWIDQAVEILSLRPVCGYRQDGSAMSEPTALAALALFAYDRKVESLAALDWLVKIQGSDGGVSVQEGAPGPYWPTSLAILAWNAAGHVWPETAARFQSPIARGVAWILTNHGNTQPRMKQMGHDPTLVGWAWVGGTHSWVEPTAMSVLALKSAGKSAHPRTREAVRMLIDRLLPEGGSNYGNTIVLGQTLRPHVQPTGISLAALAGEDDASGRIARSVEYLEFTLTSETTAASLSYGLIGLAAHGRVPAQASDWLAAAAEQTLRRGASPYRLALLLLAASGIKCPIFTAAHEGAVA